MGGGFGGANPSSQLIFGPSLSRGEEGKRETRRADIYVKLVMMATTPNK